MSLSESGDLIANHEASQVIVVRPCLPIRYAALIRTPGNGERREEAQVVAEENRVSRSPSMDDIRGVDMPVTLVVGGVRISKAQPIFGARNKLLITLHYI